MRFTCGSCGQVHEGLPQVASEVPFYFYAVPEAERRERCALTSDTCVIRYQDRSDFFVRGALEIPVLGRAEPFAWGAWISSSEAIFRRYQQAAFGGAPSSQECFTGWLSSLIPGYPNTLVLKARARSRGRDPRPLLELESTDHPLAVEQRSGITEARLLAIYESGFHASEADLGFTSWPGTAAPGP